MPVSAAKLVIQANKCIVAANQSIEATAQLAGLQKALEGVFCVANCAALPAAADNQGRFIWLTDVCSYRFSDGKIWTNDFRTNLIGACGFAWGWNYQGSLGNLSSTPVSSPVREVTSSNDWISLDTNGAFSGGLKSDRSLWMWGYNTCGFLGNNSVANQSSPVREISSSTTWCAIGISAFSTFALKCDGSLWSWGDNFCGNLGDGTKIGRSSPVREISSSSNWCKVSRGGYRHFSAIKTDGSLWTWGTNFCGTLGTGNTTFFSSPVREISSSTTWCNVQNGYRITVAQKTDGTLWAWGFNSYGQLGNQTTTNFSSPVREITSSVNWTTIGIGTFHSSAIKTDGTLWLWGLGTSGQLGQFSITNQSSPVQEITSSTDWCQVSGGCVHTAALKTNGTLWAWGSNLCGALGNNSVSNVSSPVREITSATSWSTLSAGSKQTIGIQGKISGFFAI
jgi:alpha-tubulin suppressor-like RCC1 family protein